MVSPPPSSLTGKRGRSDACCRGRCVLERLVLSAMAVLVFRAWCVEGLLAPFRVVSGSMADTLRGPHREVVCGDCGFMFACGADLDRISSRAVCPNCGFAENDLAGRPDVAGDRLLVNKAIFRLRPPKRWEVVAFRRPRNAAEIQVKRVVGLPGESIRIRQGDIYADGKMQRKTLLQQRALAVLVHDADFSPTREPPVPARWQHERREGGWQSVDGRFVHPAAEGGAATSVDWLTYHHWRRVPGQPGETVDTSIQNDRGYNQTRPQRPENIHRVTDLLLSFRLVRYIGSGQLLVRAAEGGKEFLVEIEPEENRFEVLRNGRPLSPPAQGSFPRRSKEVQLEVSLIDRQFLLALDGRTAVAHPYERDDAPPDTASRPLAIGSRGLGVELRHVRVYRDVYYTRPLGPTARWGLDKPATLGPDEYFVLGDNSPISDDSRTWPFGPAVPAKLLVGKPFL